MAEEEQTHYLVTPEGTVKEAPDSFIKENGGWKTLKEQGWQLAQEKHLAPLREARLTPEEKEVARTGKRKQPAQLKDPTTEGVQGFMEGVAEHPWMVPGLLAPGLAVEAIGAVSPEAQKKIGEVGGGLMTGVAKSFADLPVSVAGLTERVATGGVGPQSDTRKAINRYQEISEGLEANKPITTGIGEFSGTVGSALGGVGTTGAIAKLGAGVSERVAAKLAVKEAEQVVGKGLLRKAAAKAGGAAAAGGTENVLFQLADLDAKLEADPAPTFGKYAAGAGLDFLLGAGIGVGTAGAAGLTKSIAGRLRSSAETLATRSAGLPSTTTSRPSGGRLGSTLLDDGLLGGSPEETLTNVQRERNKVLKDISDKVAAYRPDIAEDLNPASGRGGEYNPLTWRGTEQEPVSVRPPGAAVSGGEPAPIGTKWWESPSPKMGEPTLEDVRIAQDIHEAGGTVKGRGIHTTEDLQKLGEGEVLSALPEGGYLRSSPGAAKIIADMPLVRDGKVSPDAMGQWINMMRKPDVPFETAVVKYALNPEDASWMGREAYTGVGGGPGGTKVVPRWEGGVVPKGEGGTVPPVESFGPEHQPFPGARARGPLRAAPPGYLGEPPLSGSQFENAPTVRPEPDVDLGSLHPAPPPFEFPKTKTASLSDILKGNGIPNDPALKDLVAKHDALQTLQAALEGAAKEHRGGQDMLGILKLIGKGGLPIGVLELLTGHSGSQAALMAAIGGVMFSLAKPGDAFAAKSLAKGARAMGLIAGAEGFEKAARSAAYDFIRGGGGKPATVQPANNDRFEELYKSVSDLRDNPEKTSALVDQHVGAAAGPNTRAAAAMKITSVVNNLGANIPQIAKPDPLRPGKQRPLPDSQKDKFLMAADGADGPRFLELMGQGRVTQERWDSFQLNHPEAVDTVRQALLAQIGDADELDWRQRQQIGIIFGVLGYGTTPELVRVLQSKFDTAEEQKQAEDQEARIAGKTKTFSEKPYLTDTDRAEMGEH